MKNKIFITSLYIFFIQIMALATPSWLTNEQFEFRISKAILLHNKPIEKMQDPNMTRKLLSVFQKKAKWIGRHKIIGMVIPSNFWRVDRGDFIGSIRRKYLFAYVVLSSRKQDEYILVYVMFYRHNEFLGLIFSDIDLWSRLMSVYRIKKSVYNSE